MLKCKLKLDALGFTMLMPCVFVVNDETVLVFASVDAPSCKVSVDNYLL